MWFSGGPATGTFKHQTCCLTTEAPKTFQSFLGDSQVSKDIQRPHFNSPNWGLSKGTAITQRGPLTPQRPPTSPVSSGSSGWEKSLTPVSLCATPHTCNAPMHMCTVMHTCTHTDSSAQSQLGWGKDLKLCQERSTMKRNNPHRCAGRWTGHAQTGF